MSSGHAAKNPLSRKRLQGSLVAPNAAGEEFPHGGVFCCSNRVDQRLCFR